MATQFASLNFLFEDDSIKLSRKRQRLLDSQREMRERLHPAETSLEPERPRKSARLAKLGEFYSVEEIAGAWGRSPNYIKKLFAKEPGVMADPNGGKKKPKKKQAKMATHDAGEEKRTYTTLIIPDSVYFRVCHRLGHQSL